MLLFALLAPASLAQQVAAQPSSVASAPQAPETPAAINQNPGAQKARSLLLQAIQALGGQAYLSIKDIQEEGRTYVFDHGQPAGGGIPFWLFWQWPDKQRVELTKQRDVIYIYKDDRGYEKTYRGTRAFDEKEMQTYLRERNLSVALLLRSKLNDPTVALFYDGRAFAGDNPADQISLMNAQNQSVTIFLDSISHLPVKTSVTIRDPETRERDTYEEVDSNFHLVQGIQTPYNVTAFHNGDMTRQRFVNHVSYNNRLPDSLFNATVTYNPPVFH